ncbi:hypothetical protein B4135_0805 [Caldibacillus debilis]|uniref:Uncharacterized protein n=1 Tax=Caldibacillus debilis TaxID=301148 RepID=A0A150M696_9BACI|nr:hypothetical protein B4135_0805 [Caldibacillus debilis]
MAASVPKIAVNNERKETKIEQYGPSDPRGSGGSAVPPGFPAGVVRRLPFFREKNIL